MIMFEVEIFHLSNITMLVNDFQSIKEQWKIEDKTEIVLQSKYLLIAREN